jgi:hypothetical protein
MLLGVSFVATLPLIFHQISATSSPKKRNADGGFRVALWLGRRSCVAKSEEYRRFAEECLVLARNAEDERTRALLLHMAQVWFRLAEERTNETDERQLAGS